MSELLAPKRMVELEVDGQSVSVFEGSTILDACAKLGIDTPTLCYGDTLQPANVCRVCVVEIEGGRVLAPACSRKAEDEIALIREIGQAMRDASICGLGQTASSAIESAIERLGAFTS